MVGFDNETLNCSALSGITELDSTTTDTIVSCQCKVNDQLGTSYTITATDMCKTVALNNGSAITLYCPEDSTENLGVGFHCRFVQKGAGQITVTPEGTDTIVSLSGATKSSGQYAVGELVKLESGTWLLFGDITT